MPQMSPMNWMILGIIMTTGSITFFILSFYSMESPQMNYSLNKKNQPNYLFIKW